MIHLIIFAVDGETSYAITTSHVPYVLEFNERYGHEGCDYQLELGGKDLDMPEIEAWFETARNDYPTTD